MDNNRFDINAWYVGEVRKADPKTHVLEVYVPRLTPTLNYGFSDMMYSTGLQTNVLKSNTLICKPYDFKKMVPRVGSLVHVTFLGEDIKSVYWRDFDPFGENKYIPFKMTEKEKTLDDFTKTFNMTLTKEWFNMIPKNKQTRIGSESNPVRELHGRIDVKYIVGLSGILETVYDNINGMSENISEVFEDVSEKVHEVGSRVNSMSLYNNVWTDSGKLRSGIHEDGDVIWQRSLSVEFSGATPGSGILGKYKYSYLLIELEDDQEFDYVNVSGSYVLDGDIYMLNSYYIGDDEKEIISNVIVKDKNKVVFNSLSTDMIAPESADFIIEATTSDNEIPNK